MSGWVTPGSGSGAASGPVAWEAPQETPGLGVREMLRGAWRLYRSAGRALLLVAIVGELVQAVFTIPSIQVVVVEAQGAIRVFGDFARFRSDPQGFNAAFQAAMRPPSDLLVLSAIAGGIGIGILILIYAALTAAALDAAGGRRVGIASAFRAVAARSSAIVIPAIVVAFAWAAITAASASVQPTEPIATPGQSVLYGLFGLLIFVLSIGAFVLAVTWALALPAILAEDLSLRRGLARGAELTRGVRFRLGLAFVAIIVLQGLTVGISGAALALIGGVAAQSLEVGIVVYFVANLIGGVVWLPIIPSMLAVVYRDRVKREGEARSAGAETSIGNAEPGLPGEP